MTRCFVLAMPFAPELCSRSRKAKPKAFPKISSLKKRREAERRETRVEKDRIIKRCGAHPYSRPPLFGEDRGRIPIELGPHGAGALAFRRPTAALRRVSSRLGSGRASWNHRMQAGGPSPAPVQRAPRSPTRAGRDDAQAARERSVSPRPREPPPLRLKEYPRERRPSRAGWWECNRGGDESQGQCRFIRDAS